jgi:hypothetical protein
MRAFISAVLAILFLVFSSERGTPLSDIMSNQISQVTDTLEHPENSNQSRFISRKKDIWNELENPGLSASEIS